MFVIEIELWLFVYTVKFRDYSLIRNSSERDLPNIVIEKLLDGAKLIGF